MKNEKDESFRILAKGVRQSENSRVTGLNNNMLVTGISGCGKTGSFVNPNINSAHNSIVVVDTKGLLYDRHRAALKKRGYRTMLVDFVHPEKSVPYNPLDGVKRFKKKVTRVIWPGDYDEMNDLAIDAEVAEEEIVSYRQQDLMRISQLLIPRNMDDEAFWPMSAQQVLESLMAYVLEVLPEKEQNFGSVARLFREMCRETGAKDFQDVSFFAELEHEYPESFAVNKYRMYYGNIKAEKCWASIIQFVSNALAVFDYDENAAMLCNKGIDLADIGREKTALFVNVSDTDRSMDSIVNVFYTQMFQLLCNEADSRPDGRLAVPVHIMLDDFAANVYIPDFDKIISVIRSRDISVSVMLQSISQLRGLYTDGQASTIINNCDTMLYMGGQDVETARFFADKAGRLPEGILSLDLNQEWLFVRGQAARIVEKIPPYSTQIE
ncbi:MAG: type IV secretory system conjugative DNA transfer family protein [Lachnospiraceae bacterium]|nr:type IV secretory system conjugative DNA transfer family protein [Lachnospiraceae bacterium]